MDFEMDREARIKCIVRRKADVSALSRALLKKDYRAVETAGHQIKGSACSYGFDSLTTAAADLEIFAREKDMEGTTIKLSALEIEVDKLSV